MLKKPSKRLHFAILFDESVRRSQISQNSACKCNRLTERRLSHKITICAIFRGRKAAFSGQKRRVFAAAAAPLGRNGVLVGVQRGARCRPAAAPLQPRGAATARPPLGERDFSAIRSQNTHIFVCPDFFSNNVYSFPSLKTLMTLKTLKTLMPFEPSKSFPITKKGSQIMFFRIIYVTLHHGCSFVA